MDSHEEMQKILAQLQSDNRVRKMKDFIQHGRISTYEHCESVAKLSYSIDRLFSLHSDLKVLLTGAMLHDYYLYDWHAEDNGEHRLHGFRHAEKACLNAKEHFNTDDETNHVIYCHMWPLNPGRVPRSREAWIVCIADKLVSLHETLFMRQPGETDGNGTEAANKP